MPDQTITKHLHLKKEVTWGHLISTAFLVAAMIGIYTDNIIQHQNADKRLSVIETQIETQHEQVMLIRTSVDSRLTSIDAKLDRLIERMINK